MNGEEITLRGDSIEDIAAACRKLALGLRADAADIEGREALIKGVHYGHPAARVEEARLLREAAKAIDDVLAKWGERRAGACPEEMLICLNMLAEREAAVCQNLPKLAA